MASSDTYKRAIGLYQAGMLDRAPSAKRSLTSSRTTLKPWICRRWTMSTGSLARRAFKRQQHARDQTRRRCGAGQPRQCPAPAASATLVRGASQTEIWCRARPPTSSCGRRVPWQCAWPSPRILAALHRTLVGLGPGFRAAGPFDVTVSRLFCRLSRSPESPSGD